MKAPLKERVFMSAAYFSYRECVVPTARMEKLEKRLVFLSLV